MIDFFCQILDQNTRSKHHGNSQRVRMARSFFKIRY